MSFMKTTLIIQQFHPGTRSAKRWVRMALTSLMSLYIVFILYNVHICSFPSVHADSCGNWLGRRANKVLVQLSCKSMTLLLLIGHSDLKEQVNQKKNQKIYYFHFCLKKSFILLWGKKLKLPQLKACNSYSTHGENKASPTFVRSQKKELKPSESKGSFYLIKMLMNIFQSLFAQVYANLH